MKKLTGKTFSQDEDANKIGVTVTKDGAPVTLTGDVVGYVILPDGTMVNDIEGDSDENTAWIVLPEEAYAQRGQITIIIKLVNGTDVMTLGAVEACVY